MRNGLSVCLCNVQRRDRARRRQGAQTLGLPLITSVILRELERRLAQGMRRFLPVPFYRTGRTGWVREEL